MGKGECLGKGTKQLPGEKVMGKKEWKKTFSAESGATGGSNGET